MNAAQFILSLIPTGGRAEINSDTLHYEVIDISSGACRLKVNDGEYEDISFNALPDELKHKLELDSITHGLDSKLERDAQELTIKQRSAIRAWYERDPKRNQESVAELFISLNTGRVCYSYELRRWLIYNGKYWEIDNANVKIEGLLIAFNKDIIEVISEDKQNWRDTAAEAKRKEAFYTWAIRLNDRPALDNVLSIAGNKCAVSLTEFDTRDLLYNVNNGTINLKTGKLRAHSPDDKITLICDVNYYKGAQYDRWDNTLKDACGRPEYVRYLQREFGYCLTALANEEFLPILLGEPLTGKSTFYESIMEVFGDYGHYMNFSTLKHSDKDGGAPREDILRLRTARLVMCSEINPKTVFDTALIKKITSGEKLVARGIRARDSVEFTPKFKVCIGTNYSPIIPYDDGGTYRRCKVNP